jgi:valyl-tRNA synthetase
MGWPDQTDDFKAFYPTSLLETGLDILFFWVARMVMMGLELTDSLPFHTVFLHAMVRDKEGRKMSKSLGNVIDPLEVINGCSLASLQDRLTGGNLPPKEVDRAKKNNELEFPEGIPECGSDALRFGLLAYTVQGRDINLDVKRVVGYRLFCNKLWNATRFALRFVSDFKPTATLLKDLIESGYASTRDNFMISRLMRASELINDCLISYRFGDAQQAAYAFWMDDICDVYLELIKPVVYDTSEENKDTRWAAQATLWLALEAGLKLLHPLMPFVTEELWQRLPGRGTLGSSEPESIMLAQYPECIAAYKNDEAEMAMAETMKVVKACRSLRASYHIPHKTLTHFFIKASDASKKTILRQIDDIKTLGRGSEVDVNSSDDKVPQLVGTLIVDDQLTILMDVKGLVDFQVEINRLKKSLDTTAAMIERTTTKMTAMDYATKVPEEVQAIDKEQLESSTKKMREIEEAIANFERLAILDHK